MDPDTGETSWKAPAGYRVVVRDHGRRLRELWIKATRRRVAREDVDEAMRLFLGEVPLKARLLRDGSVFLEHRSDATRWDAVALGSLPTRAELGAPGARQTGSRQALLANASVGSEAHGLWLAELVLGLEASPDRRIAACLSACDAAAPSAAWRQAARIPWADEVRSFCEAVARARPVSPGSSVVWFVMHDTCEAIDVAELSSWSGDVDDWDWWYQSRTDVTTIATPALASVAQLFDQLREPAAWGVCTFGFLLACSCILVEHAVATNASTLGARVAGRVGVVVGAPEQGFGVILGSVVDGSWAPQPQFPHALAAGD
jgi:hypothetical protein